LHNFNVPFVKPSKKIIPKTLASSSTTADFTNYYLWCHKILLAHFLNQDPNRSTLEAPTTMSKPTQKPTQAKAHLVGSFPALNAEVAMRKAITDLKDLLISLPDAETGWRNYFTAGLFQKIASQSP
jgi:hypothetical protein